MCLQCMTKAVSYGEALPGFHLMKAAKDDYPHDPGWKFDQFGLVECNDPSVYFSKSFMKDPGDNAPDKEFLDFLEVGGEVNQDIMAADDPRIVYRLIAAAVSKGYDSREDGNFGCWLSDYLAKYLETAQIVEDLGDEEDESVQSS